MNINKKENSMITGSLLQQYFNKTNKTAVTKNKASQSKQKFHSILKVTSVYIKIDLILNVPEKMQALTYKKWSMLF